VSRAAAALWLGCAVAASCTRDPRVTLLVYSPHGKELLQDVATRFERAHPGIHVEWEDMPSQTALDRVRAEAPNPQADIWFGAPSDLFARAAQEGLLEPFTPTWAAEVPPEAHDSVDRWYGTYLTPEVIGYNDQLVPDSLAPRDWDDLLDPRWHGKLILRDPVESGSMKEVIGAILARSIATTGSTAAGWTWLRRLDANTREYAFQPTVLYQKLARGEGLVTIYDMPDLALLRQRLHLPIAYVIPTSGTPLVVDAIAVVHGTHHLAEAHAFEEFVATPALMLVAARDHLRIPARIDLPEDSLPDWIRAARRELKPLPVDRALVADSLDAWMQYWDAHIRRGG
jgi:iron(III) transport system substrate-binding protein